jgi:hypothetical protein
VSVQMVLVFEFGSLKTTFHLLLAYLDVWSGSGGLTGDGGVGGGDRGIGGRDGEGLGVDVGDEEVLDVDSHCIDCLD